jgi:hypothetical protein
MQHVLKKELPGSPGMGKEKPKGLWNFAVTDRTLPPPGAEAAVIQPFKT